MSDINQKYEIGFTWDFYSRLYQGVRQRKVLDAKEHEGALYYLIGKNENHHDFKDFAEVREAGQLDELIERDGKNLEFNLKAAKEREIQKQKEEERKRIEEDTNGFADQFSPMQRAKIINALNKLKRVDGRIMTRKEFVRARVLEGDKPEIITFCDPYGRKINGERVCKKDKTEYTLTEKDGNTSHIITKTEYDYAGYLIKIGYN
jgi:hypothetical protein